MSFLSSLAVSIGTWLGGSAFAMAVGRIAVGLVFNALAAALARPDAPRDRSGIVGQIQQGAEQPRSFIMGTYATAGSLVYHNAWGETSKTPNAYYTRVTALSDVPVQGLVEVWINGQRCTIDTSVERDQGYPINEYKGGDHEYAWIRFYDGTQTAADSFLMSKVSSTERPWGADRIGTGIAYAILTTRYDRENGFWQGFPQARYVLQGPAAAGTDPVSQIAYVLDGVSQNGQWLYGPQGQGAALYDAAEITSEAAKCTADVPGASAMSDAEKISAFGSTTVPSRYRSGIEVRVDRQVADIVEELAAACNGRVSPVADRYRVQVGDPGTAAFSFSDDDIIATSGQTFAPFFPLAETVNAISATYPEPDQAWETQDAPPLRVAAFEAEDSNRRLTTSAPLPAVPYREQAQRLMAAALAEARRARRHTVVLPARFCVIEPGDFGGWTSARNGYDGKLFRVDGVRDLKNGDVEVDLTEVDPTDYDWSAQQDFTPVSAGSIAWQTVPPAGGDGWSVSGVTIDDENSTVARPAILLSWDDTLDDIELVRWEVEHIDSGEVVNNGTTAGYAIGRTYIVEGLLPSNAYRVRGRFVPGTRRATEWSPWMPVTTPAGVSEASLLFDDLNAALDAQIAGIEDDIDDVIATAEAIDQRVDGVAVDLGNLESSVTTVETAAANNTAAIGQLTTTVNANYQDLSASVSTQASAIAGIESDLAAMYRVQVAAGGASAGFEIVAADGSPSTIRFRADNLIFDGEITTSFLSDGAMVKRRFQTDTNVITLNANTHTEISWVSKVVDFTAFIEVDYDLMLSARDTAQSGGPYYVHIRIRAGNSATRSNNPVIKEALCECLDVSQVLFANISESVDARGIGDGVGGGTTYVSVEARLGGIGYAGKRFEARTGTRKIAAVWTMKAN